MRELVAHAYERVPYYRRLLDSHGVRPERVRGVADLTLVPTTTRSDLASLPAAEVVAAGFTPERLIAVRTSGSSGMPFTSRRTWLEHRRLHGLRARALLSAGLTLGDRVARVCTIGKGNPRDRKLLGHLLHAAGVVRQHRIDTFLPADEIARRLSAIRPDIVAGTPGVLALVAEHFDRRHPPRLVFTGSEMLTGDIRERITTGFGAAVRDIYGSSELMLLAWECGHTGAMHTADDAVVLEVLHGDDRPVAPGQTGEVVGTSLHAFAMPLIRYRQGDLATQGDGCCACGRATGTVRGVVGRTLDLFPLADGRLMHPYEIVACFKEDLGRWVAQYQLVQQATDHVVLRVVPRGEVPAERLGAIAARALDLLGPAVQFDVVTTQVIPIEPSGKMRVCRSHVRSLYDSTLAAAG